MLDFSDILWQLIPPASFALCENTVLSQGGAHGWQETPQLNIWTMSCGVGYYLESWGTHQRACIYILNVNKTSPRKGGIRQNLRGVIEEPKRGNRSSSSSQHEHRLGQFSVSFLLSVLNFHLWASPNIPLFLYYDTEWTKVSEPNFLWYLLSCMSPF